MKLRAAPLVLAFGTAALGAPRSPSVRPTATRSANAEALTAIRRALRAIGPAARVAAIRSIAYDGRGRQFRETERQGRSPDSTLGAPHEERIAVDFAAPATAFEFHTEDPTVGPRWRRAIDRNREAIVLGFVMRTASRAAASDRERISRARRVPLALLREALEHPDRLQIERSAVVYRPPEGGVVALRFHSTDGRLASVESVVDFPGKGLLPVNFEFFGDIEPEPGLHFPSGHRQWLGGRLLEEVHYENFRLDAPSDLFAVPDAFHAFIDPPGTVAVVAPGIYEVENLYSDNLIFVEFRSFVLALEAPAPYPALGVIPATTEVGRNEISEAYLKKIREAVPGKPVRYVVLTHHHSDHAGGAEVFVKAGATILATPGDRKHFESAIPGAHVETIADERTISDGVQEIRLYNVGKNPHSDEMLIAEFPVPRLVYQSDLFFPNDRRVSPKPRYPPVMTFFAEWLTARHIRPAKIFGFHTPGFQTMADVADVLDDARNRQ